MRILSVFLVALALIGTGSVAAQDWALKGEWAESCSCAPVCPCVFESEPTRGHCEGSALMRIEDSHYGTVEVDDVDVVMTYRMGEWLRLYIDENATDEQVEAIGKLLNQERTFGMLFALEKGILSTEKTRVTVETSESRIAFSVADSTVELVPMKGQNGKVIRIENLAVPWFLSGYNQYRAVTTQHKRGDSDFSYAGTNGATSSIDISSDDEAKK